ncbi:MAG TPA: CsgG/HfaB family protein, partial [Candidatus Bathyarchaeia archaeon]|nr:CsgG/HfaB family protein [Candidatus Bathyarchaeia archaeon]
MSICRGRVRRTYAALVLVLFSASTCLASFADAMKSGEALYRKGEYQQATADLESARAQDPADAQAALLLGLTYLRLDMPRKAAEEWQDYVKSARDPKLADDVARFRTILLREANQRDARAALADESKLSAAPADPQAVAVNTFRNLGAQEYAPLGKALAAMLIANLSAVPNLKVLERERVETLAQEVRLGGSGLVDKRTAAREGKLLRAQNVVAGSYADKQGAPPPIQTESSLFDARRNAEIGSSSAEAPVNEFYRIVPQTSAALLAGLGNPVRGLPADQATQAQNEHTRSLPAVLAFGRGLDLKDQGDYPGARAQFELALHEDPSFDLPRKELAVLPAALISLQAIANTVESAALAAPVEGASGLGVSGRTLAIVGGAAVIAGGIAAGVALSGGGGGGGGNNGAPGIQGATDQTIAVEGQVRFEVTATDPQGRTVTLSAQDLPPGASFPTISGSPATQTFLWTPRADQVGTFPVVFVASSAGGTTQKTVTITVNPTGPTGGPTATPCAAANAACSSNLQCCNNNAC